MEGQQTTNQQQLTTLQKVFRFIRRTFYFLLTLVLLIVIAAAVLVYKYEDKVKQAIVSELNKNLKSPVLINPADISFSILKNFPYASLDFKNVKILEVTSKTRKDTLINAGLVSLQFNVINLMKEDYRIQQVNIEDGYARFKVDVHGKNNYEFWKTDTAKNNSGKSQTFDLEKVKIRHIRFAYDDDESKTDLLFNIDKSVLSGQFSGSSYTTSIDLDAYINHMKVDDVNYVLEKEMNANTLLQVSSDKYTFNNTKLKLNGLTFDVKGAIDNSKKPIALDLHFRSSKGDIQSFLSLLPEKYKEDMKDYTSKGDFVIKVDMVGLSDAKHTPFIDANFEIEHGEISNSVKDIQLNHVNINARYSNKNKTDRLEATQFSCNVKEGFIKGVFSVTDFKQPFLDATLSADLSLDELKKVFKSDTVESLTGKMLVNGSFSGRLKGSGGVTSEDIRNIKASGNVQIQHLSMRLKNNALTFDSINGDVTFDNLNMEVKQFTGKVSGSDLSLTGSLVNIFPYLLYKEEDVVIKAALRSDHIVLDQLMASKNNSTTTDTSYRFVLPDKVDFVLDCSIKKLSFRKFEAQDISGSLKIRDKKLMFDPMSFKTMQGSVSGTFMADASLSQGVLMSTDLELKNINITQLFYQFENFGQEVIVDKNIKGTANSTIQFASLWKPSLEIIPDKIVAYCDLTIDKGELIKWESLKSLSKFVKVSELENVKFSKLQNRIEIRNQTIYIPKMDIKSSALNIMASGSHTFENMIDYSIRVQLNELLSKHARDNKRENDEFGEVADDGTGKIALYIRMTGNIEDPVIKYDRKGAKQKLKEDVKIEKQTMKEILKEEFGWFKKDTTLKGNNTKKDQPKDKFMIEWGDDKSKQKESEEEE